MSILGRWTGRVLTTETDKQLGRWSCVSLQEKEDKTIRVYNAYRVLQETLPGPFTAYAQQYQLMQENDDPNLRPRRKFVTDLIETIKSKQKDGKTQII